MLIQDVIPPVKKRIKSIAKIIKKQRRNKHVSIFLVCLLFFEIVGGVLSPFKLEPPDISIQKAEAAGEGWIAGGTWNNRRAIILSSATTVANYQVKITLTAENFDYTKLAFPATGADLRFTGSDGTTLQDYWIESWVNGGTSTIWVEVATSETSMIYIYYGNVSATAESNGTNTFIFFDDFEDSDKTQYTETGTGTWLETGGFLKQTSVSSYEAKITKDIGLLDYVLEVKLRPDFFDADKRMGLLGRLNTGNNRGYNGLITDSDVTKVATLDDIIAWGTSGSVDFSFTVGSWYNFRLDIAGNSQKVKAWQANTIESLAFQSTSAFTSHTTETRVGMNGGIGSNMSYDDFRVRKYVATEPTTSVYAEQANNTYTYKRAITVTNGGGALTDYQIGSITIDTSDTARFHNSCADIRFTSDAANWNEQSWAISYPFWIESGCGTATTKVWVKMDSIPAGVNTIYIYYGNASATAGSNGSNTFEFFDGADSLSAWTTTGGSPVQSGSEIQLVSASGAEGIRSTPTFGVNYAIRSREKKTGTGLTVAYSAFGDGTATDIDGTLHRAGVYKYNNSGYANNTANGPQVQTAFTLNDDNYHTYDIIRNSTTNIIYRMDDAVVVTHTTNISSNSLYVQFSTRAVSPDGEFIDWVFVRKYATIEPSPSVGSETFNNTAPTATAPTAAQATDGTGYVTIVTTIDDTDDNDTVRFQVEYSLDGGSTWTSGDPYLTSYVTTSPNQATQPDVTNAQQYQVGMPTNNIITSAGANTVTVKWDTKSASNGTGAIGNEANVKLRVTPYDGTSIGTPAVSASAFAIDNATPSGGTIQINSNDAYTASKDAILTLSAIGASQMNFSNDNITYSAYEAYGVSKSWDITDALYGGTAAEGAKTVYVKYKDAYGNESAAVSDNIVYDITVPVNPTSAIDAQGAVTDTWQNNKNDPNFTSFTGESDSNGIAGFYAYFDIDSAGTDLSNWISTDAFNPASFIASSARYLRVIAKDNAGLYADPDGAGIVCDNTNINRPADADCWATIFIHKYDIDAPNTPNPASFPSSWTKTNSFDFSWSDPLDNGGSGVKDYTYRTNAGTSATTTAALLVGGLISDTDGTKIFYSKANDNAGNSGVEGLANFYFDSTIPVNAGVVTDGNGSSNNAYGIVSDPDFTWVAGSDAGDQSGVKEYDVYWGIDSSGTVVSATVAVNAYNPAAILANTPYYLRIRTRDNALNESAWETKYTMKYSQAASNPSGFSQTANSANLALGGWTNDTTPTFNFTLSDSDNDTLGYVIKIDNNSDFSSPEIFYTYSANDLVSGEEVNFTVGQAAGTGVYTNGLEGQTLGEDEYYWKIQASESHGLVSSEIAANSGAVAIGIDTSDPAGTVLGFGTITADSVEATVSSASDSVSGLHTAPYYFTNISTAANSGWQTGVTWNSGSLMPNTQYIFRITSRDKAGNTEVTATQDKYTLANIPSSLTLIADSQTQITASWNNNSNSEGTEYYIENTTIGTNSGWIAGLSWISSNLSCGMSYSFKVKARNNDGIDTLFTDAVSALTANCGGGGLPPVAYNPPVPPIANSTNPDASFKVSINQDAVFTNNSAVNLDFVAGADTFRMSISENPDFINSAQESFQASKNYTLSPGDGLKTIYVRFYTFYGVSSQTFSDSIILDTALLTIPTPTATPAISPSIAIIPAPSAAPILENTESTITPSPEIFSKPINSDWNLLPAPKLERFSSQLNEISFFTEKIPSLSGIFKDLNIFKISDISSRTPSVSFKIPDLLEIIGFKPFSNNTDQTAPSSLINLPVDLKQQIPSEIVFASFNSDKINLDSSLVLDGDLLKQKLSVPPSSNLNIILKPDQPAQSINGYLAMKKSAYSANFIFQDLSFWDYLSDLLFVRVSAEESKIEQRFVLAQFQYGDSDKDGIWTADIQTPAVMGDYEIISLVNYQDSAIPSKEIRLIVVIDPEGYVYESEGSRETRIPDAVVSIFYLNPQTDQYELWPAKEYDQKNPQITDNTGKYSFLVPEGTYYIKAEAPGYYLYKSDMFVVSDAQNVHMNLELMPEFSFARDWERIVIAGLTIVVFALAYFLAYNFYQDRKRIAS